ncbi:LysR family transcriptional regulator [Paraburkholderia sp. MPAMCS5]|uniref:LysR family transcriptional regulator n=1 Tax=Paraburkholderia sp. MPAMCS5 TaxID=3112563 RepID=UPI002E175899|nr:LysR family transcriptional regulator [Paraburkholderia sp. MPAMCS5]
MLPVTLRGLQVFVAVVDSGGFGAAAATLNISQPSVSVHIRELEAKLGSPLFERHPGVSPQLTTAGRAFYSYALETLERTTAISANLKKSKRKLRFAAQRFAADSLLSKALGEFSTAFPQIELVALAGTFEEVHSLCSRGQVDLGFLLSNGKVPRLDAEPLGRYRLAFIGSPDHPLANEADIPIETLAQYPFIVAYDTSYFGRTIASMLRAAGLAEPNVASQAQEMSMVRNMVMAGIGIACSLRRSVQKDIAAGTIVELDVDVAPMHLTLHYVRNPKSSMPEIDRLIDMVRQAESLPS